MIRQHSDSVVRTTVHDWWDLTYYGGLRWLAPAMPSASTPTAPACISGLRQWLPVQIGLRSSNGLLLAFFDSLHGVHRHVTQPSRTAVLLHLNNASTAGKPGSPQPGLSISVAPLTFAELARRLTNRAHSTQTFPVVSAFRREMHLTWSHQVAGVDHRANPASVGFHQILEEGHQPK